MKRSKFFLLIVLFSLLSSCFVIPEKLSGLKFGKQDTQVASKTLNYSVKWVDEATLKVLDEMEIIVIENDNTADGKSIKAATLDLDILIELKPVTESSTHMEINIKSLSSQKHDPTATEIINQTKAYLLADQNVEKTNVAERLDLELDNLPAENSSSE